jgi:hypothetical protein
LTVDYLYLSEIIDLAPLNNLRRLGFVVPTLERAKDVGILLDIAKVLSTIQASRNRLETMTLDVMVRGGSSWPGTHAQDWAAVAQEAGRLSMGRCLVLKVKMRRSSDYGSGGSTTDVACDLSAYIDKAFQEALVSYGHVEYRSVYLM